ALLQTSVNGSVSPQTSSSVPPRAAVTAGAKPPTTVSAAARWCANTSKVSTPWGCRRRLNDASRSRSVSARSHRSANWNTRYPESASNTRPSPSRTAQWPPARRIASETNELTTASAPVTKTGRNRSAVAYSRNEVNGSVSSTLLAEETYTTYSSVHSSATGWTPVTVSPGCSRPPGSAPGWRCRRSPRVIGGWPG